MAANAMSDVPPLPPGFKLDTPAPTTPPLPEGFKLDSEPPAQAPRSGMDKLLGIGGERYQTWPERAVRGASGVVKNLVDASNTEPAGSRAATEAMVGPAFEAAQLFSPMSVAGTVGKAAVPAAKNALLDVEGLKSASRARYKSPKFDEIQLKPEALAGLKTNISNFLQGPGEGYRTSNAKGTFDALDELVNPFGRTKETTTPNLRDILVVRDVLKNVPYGTPDGTAASKAVKMIENYLNNIPGEHVVKGDVKDVQGLISAAGQDWKAAKKLELLGNQEEKGVDRASVSGKGGNMDNAVRQRIHEIKWGNNGREWNRFSPEEQAAMQKIIDGSKIGNAARWLSFLDPLKHQTTALPSLLTAGYQVGDMAAMALGGVGRVAQKVAESKTTGAVDKLRDSIQRGAPSNAGRVATPKPKAISPEAWRALRLGITPPPAIVEGNDPFNPLTNPNAL